MILARATEFHLNDDLYYSQYDDHRTYYIGCNPDTSYIIQLDDIEDYYPFKYKYINGNIELNLEWIDPSKEYEEEILEE